MNLSGLTAINAGAEQINRNVESAIENSRQREVERNQINDSKTEKRTQEQADFTRRQESQEQNVRNAEIRANEQSQRQKQLETRQQEREVAESRNEQPRNTRQDADDVLGTRIDTYA